jgi:opacity protein-like surface antigen
VALVAGVGTAQAQHRTQRDAAPITPSGFMIGAHSVAAFGTSVAVENGGNPLKTKLGPGGGVQLGYAFNPRIMVFASADIAKQAADRFGTGNLGLTHIDLGARVGIPVNPTSRVLPYAMGTVGHRSLGTTIVADDGTRAHLSYSGLSFGVGGGLQYFMSPRFAVDGGVNVGFGKFGTVKLDGHTVPEVKAPNSTTARAMFGVNWYL